jgi:hypothetical protein
MKSMREMIKLMEGVMAVPGVGNSESDMQTAGTVGRDQADASFDAAQPPVTESEMSEVLFRQTMDRILQLSDSFVPVDDALETVAKELEQQGCSSEEISTIMAAVEQELWSGDDGPDSVFGDDMDNMQADADALASVGHGSDEDYGADDFPMEDIQNGYNDVNVANGNDFFPNGADSPVVKATGPSGARQGDNPEQKKMQVQEVHKELVYNYRSYLNESKKSNGDYCDK